MIGHRPLRLGLVALLTCASFCCQAQEIVWGAFDMPRARSGCYLEGSASDLKAKLRSFGWRSQGNNFPAIAWNRHMVAIVVPTQGEALEPTSIGVASDEVVVHLSTSRQSHGGIVLQVPESYAKLQTCRLQSEESPDRVYPMIVYALSLDSATNNDQPVDESVPRRDPVANESHTLPPTSTLPATEAPQ